ncbi:MAG: hypothetical protein PGN14_03070 [Sphingomonas adhaesiva]
MTAARTGRPLRFMGLVLGGWIATRVWWLWPVAAPLLPDAMRAIIPPPITAAAPATPGSPLAVPIAVPPPVTWRRPSPPAAAPTVRQATRSPDPPPPATGDPAPAPAAAATTDRHTFALLGMVRYGVPAAPPAGPSRWSGSAWGIVRDGRQRAGVATPQLGGSQIGARLAYTLDIDRRIALAVRMSSALAVRQQEAAVGIEWQPRTLPVRLALERRLGIAGSRGGTALGVSGGVDDRPLAAGFRLDGYAQAGAIARDGVEPYADGAVRVARPIMPALDVGMGAWGAAQRGAARADIGPTAALTLPAGARRLRVTLDWRQRIAGDARPASGPALSLGTDF